MGIAKVILTFWARYVLVGPMKSKMGRPKGPEKVIYRKRLTPEDRDRLVEIVHSWGARDSVNNTPSKAKGYEYGTSTLSEPQKAVESKGTASGLVSKSLDVIHELRTQNYQLACNEQRLTEEVASLKASLECARSGDSSELVTLLRVRNAELEAKIRNLESERA